MRYLFAKTEFPTELPSKQGLTTRELAYFCKHCGAELMGVFEYCYDVWDGTIRDLESMKSRIKPLSTPERQKIEEFDRKIREAQWKAEIAEASREKATQAYNDAASLKQCPICGMPLHQEIGYYLPDRSYTDWRTRLSLFSLEQDADKTALRGYPSYAVEMLEHMAALREKIESVKTQKQVEDFVNINDLPAVVNSSPAESIRKSPEELKKYIFHLIQLEHNLYSLGQQLCALYNQRLNNDRAIVLSTYEPALTVKAELEPLRAAYQKAVAGVRGAAAYQPEVTVYYPLPPSKPVYEMPGLFNKQKVMAENEALMMRYQAELVAYQNEIQRCEAEKARLIEEKRAEAVRAAQIEMYSAQAALGAAMSNGESKINALKERPVPAKAIKEILDKEISETEELLKKTITARNELYAYGVIFEKYRDVVALSSFYEYLMAGRCSSLEGADGAYNIYENEIRLNRVIAQLDTVISSLEDIKQNQYMMYQELKNIKTSLNRLNSTMDKALTSIQGIEAHTNRMSDYMQKISMNSDVIAHNTAATAYYSKVNAELTNALGYMVALK